MLRPTLKKWVFCYNKMVKLTKRKGFNFFRSYYDVYNELEGQDKIDFIDALLDRQFLGVKPTELKGMANFAYISQTNSIDSQVRGYEDKTKTKLDPCQGGAVGVNKKVLTPTLQVQEEVQEKEKEVTTIETNFVAVDSWIKEIGESPTYLEGLYRTFKLRSGCISQILIQFKEHLKIYPEKHENFSKFKIHFNNYLNTKNRNNELSKYQKQSKGQL